MAMSKRRSHVLDSLAIVKELIVTVETAGQVELAR
jgi:hypothetical protein